MPIRSGVEISEEDAAKYDELEEKAAFYDRNQYIMKIRLNSLYGAIVNKYFRFFDFRMGESVTCTGRVILTHQCAEVNRLLTGEYQFDGDAIVYGDTDSSYFLTSADNKEEAIKISDIIANQVNKILPGYMEEVFLCTDGFKELIKTARDIVADRSIFIDKKRYIMHCVDVEGMPTDKMKTMGVELKKTSLPKYIAAKLSSFIERLLKGEEWEVIAPDVVALKETLMEIDDIMVLGLPKGIKIDMKEYVAKHEKGRKVHLPGTIAASIHFNECLKNFNDIVSHPIVSGHRVRVFYLNQSYGKFKSIALPVDIEVIPKWFTDNYTIDRKAHVWRLVDKPLNNIVKAISKIVPSRQDIMREALLEF